MKSLNALQLVDSYLGRAAAGGLLAGGGAMAYNATTNPTYLTDARGRVVVDASGNPVIANENDINPLMAAGIGAGVGAGSKVVQDRVIAPLTESAQDYWARVRAERAGMQTQNFGQFVDF